MTRRYTRAAWDAEDDATLLLYEAAGGQRAKRRAPRELTVRAAAACARVGLARPTSRARSAAHDLLDVVMAWTRTTPLPSPTPVCDAAEACFIVYSHHLAPRRDYAACHAAYHAAYATRALSDAYGHAVSAAAVATTAVVDTIVARAGAPNPRTAHVTTVLFASELARVVRLETLRRMSPLVREHLPWEVIADAR